jgi:hypothetical protein
LDEADENGVLGQIEPIVEASVLGLMNVEGEKARVLFGKKVRPELRCLWKKGLLRSS